MAVKCNIAERVLDRVNKGAWGFAKDKDLEISILGNYVEYIGCNGLLLKPCADDEASPCTENVTVVNCNINLVGISFSSNSGEFFLSVGDIYGAKQPLTYEWIIDDANFDVVGASNEPSIKVKPKSGKDLSSIVAEIKLEVTDANGCKDEKTCYYTPTGMKCSNSFVPCYTVGSLSTKSLFIECFRAKSLNVYKYIPTNIE